MPGRPQRELMPVGKKSEKKWIGTASGALKHEGPERASSQLTDMLSTWKWNRSGGSNAGSVELMCAQV